MWIKEKEQLILEKDKSKSKYDAALEKMSQDLTELSRKNITEQKKIKSDHDMEIRNLEHYYEDRLEEASKQIESVKSELNEGCISTESILIQKTKIIDQR